MIAKYWFRLFGITVFCFVVIYNCNAENDSPLPDLGRDTVLVWKSQTQNSTSTFVVRIASFYPDRLFEWEDALSQGTVYIPNRDLLQAKGYNNNQLFRPGIDTRSDNETTLWLSRKIFQALKEKKEAKCNINRIPGKMTFEGNGELAVEINGSSGTLSVIKVRDGRGGERWFLDREDNPLLMKYILRNYTQTLSSITTNRNDTLRWLKGRKLQRLLTQ